MNRLVKSFMRLVVLLICGYFGNSAVVAEQLILCSFEERLITVGNVHVPSSGAREAENISRAIVTYYVKDKELQLDASLIDRLSILTRTLWGNGAKNLPFHSKEMDGPVAAAAPGKLIAVLGNNDPSYIIKVGFGDVFIEKLSRPEKGGDFYFGAGEGIVVLSELPKEFVEILKKINITGEYDGK